MDMDMDIDMGVNKLIFSSNILQYFYWIFYIEHLNFNQ